MLIGIQTTSLYTIDCYKTLTTDSSTAQCRMGWPPCRVKMMGRHKLWMKTFTCKVRVLEICLHIGFLMVALCNRADHIYFHPVSFFLLFLFPHLISVIGDWMSTILSHMVWP